MEQRVKEVRDKIAKLEARLKEWGIDLEKFRATASKANGDAKDRLHRDAEMLQIQLDEARKKLETLKKSGSAASEELKKGVDGALARLGKAFDKAKAKFE